INRLENDLSLKQGAGTVEELQKDLQQAVTAGDKPKVGEILEALLGMFKESKVTYDAVKTCKVGKDVGNAMKMGDPDIAALGRKAVGEIQAVAWLFAEKTTLPEPGISARRTSNFGARAFLSWVVVASLFELLEIQGDLLGVGTLTPVAMEKTHLEPAELQGVQGPPGPSDTPRASRITKDSWGLASLDPSTWPVFKDGFGSCNSLTIAPVPEGDPVSEGQPMESLDEALATARHENESLRQLCYDLVSLAQEKDFPEVPISHEVLLAEARKSLLAVSQQMLQAATEHDATPAGGNAQLSPCDAPAPAKPKSSSRWMPLSSPSEPARNMNDTCMSASTACTPTETCQSIKTVTSSPVSRVVSLDGRAQSPVATSPTAWSPSCPVSPMWSPAVRTRVTRFASDGTCSPVLATRATMPVMPIPGIALSPSCPAADSELWFL
ncbi:unnamed protein product, partial [Symbiodinium necroappetens]